jgi:hemerythrin superfamily protein
VKPFNESPLQDSNRIPYNEILKDPRYLEHMSQGYTLGNESEEKIKFPKLNDFNFDKEKYKRAMEYIKRTLGYDPRKRMKKEQAEKLYPVD